jgi:hypothetical protein
MGRHTTLFVATAYGILTCSKWSAAVKDFKRILHPSGSCLFILSSYYLRFFPIQVLSIVRPVVVRSVVCSLLYIRYWLTYLSFRT